MNIKTSPQNKSNSITSPKEEDSPWLQYSQMITKIFLAKRKNEDLIKESLLGK